MEEIKVGEYIRNELGQIAKIDEDLKEFINEHKSISEKDRIEFLGKIKHKANIEDLIEVGDIVHTRDVLNEDYYHMFNEEMVQATRETIQEGISLVDIMTKEQYNANCYRLED